MKYIKDLWVQRILPVLLVIISLALFNFPWIYSPVIAAYGGIFRDATEVTGTVSSIVSKYAKVNLQVTDDALDDIADGAFGPVELFHTMGELRETVTKLRGYQNQFDLDILDDPELSRVLSFFTFFQVAVIAVIALGALQVLFYFIRGNQTRAPVFMIGTSALAALFVGAEVLLYRGFPVLKFSLTPWIFLCLALAMPYRFWLWAARKLRLLYITLKNRKRRIPSARRKKILRITLSVLGAAALIFALEYLFAYVYPKHHEKYTAEDSTNTDAVYSDDAIKETLRKYGFTDKRELNKILRASYIIPGLKTTRTLGRDNTPDTCTSMTPQGVTPAGDYLLISAYCASGEHNSVIYVLNKNYHSYVKTIILPNRPHVGGITYDPIHENIWICDYQATTKTAYVSAFSMDTLKSYSFSDDSTPISYKFAKPIYSMRRTSFLDYYEGKLYIGNFKAGEDSVTTVQTFVVDEETGNIRSDSNEVSRLLKLDKEIIVPSGITLINGGIQGFTLNAQVTAMSQSFGPVNSRLLEFRNYGDLSDHLRLSSAPDRSYTLPPMLEQITAKDGKLYLCFESAAYAYRSRWNPKIDRILVLDL